MWAVQCNLDKIILSTSFLVVLIVCGLLLSEEGEVGEEGREITQWLLEKAREELTPLEGNRINDGNKRTKSKGQELGKKESGDNALT